MSVKFTLSLLNWHEENPRNLPWKAHLDAYSVWLSEIIMQQTRVEQGTAYYLAFKEQFPTIHDLAAADLSEVIKLWEGLGYYSRARNLHTTAQYISNQLNGEFPNSFEAIKQLKGVGPYTAAAIASFAFGIPKAAIDGNAYRVLSRYFGIHTPIDSSSGKKEFQQLGDALLDKERPGDFNQALMNFGALVCKPKNPDCMQCPLQAECKAFAEKTIHLLPVKSKSLTKTKRYFHYLFIQHSDHTWIKERTGKTFWRHLYEFPLIESDHTLSPDEVLLAAEEKGFLPESYTIQRIQEGLKQTLSHRHIHAIVLEIKATANFSPEGYAKTPLKELASQPFPRILYNYLQEKSLS